jgi:hypothetical protein
MAEIQVPDVTNLTEAEAKARLTDAKLTFDGVIPESSTTVEKDRVIATDPQAGALVSENAKVKLKISSGPPRQSSLPDVIGLNQSEAEEKLLADGFAVGAVRMQRSNDVATGRVSSVTARSGESLTRKPTVDLVVSRGQKTDWTDPSVIISLFGLIVFFGIGLGIFFKSGGLLTDLAQHERARGLITFLIAIATVGIALILAISTIVLKGGPDDDKRFDRGKQVLTMLIGVLGTIVGFYFGPTPTTTEQAQPLAITSTTLPDGTVGTEYPKQPLEAKGGTPPLTWSGEVEPALPDGLAFDAATGTIIGTPKKVTPKTTYRFTVTDSATPAVSKTVDLTFAVPK